MSSSYDPSVDRGALRRRAAEIGRRRLGTQPLSPDLATRRTGLKRSDDQAVAARRRLARCYAALQASPRRPDWDALTRLARGAEAAAAAARPSIDGESPAALRREARFVAAHIGLAEALYRCDLGATASALVSATKARAALCGEGAESPSLKAAQQFCSAAYAAHLSKIPILFDVDCAAAATASGSADGAAPALASTLGRLAAATKVSPVEADDKSRPLVARPPASPRAVERVASDFVAWLDSRSERGGVLVVLLDGGPPALLYARASAALRKSAAAPRRRPDAFEETAPPNSGGWSLDAVHARFAARAAAVAERCRDAPSDAATRWRCSPGGADADETTFFAARSCAALAVACFVVDVAEPQRRRRQASRDAACGKFVVAFARPFRDATAGAFVPRALASIAAAPVEKADASAASRVPERRCFCWG